MPDSNQIRYTKWEEENDSQELCRKCLKRGSYSYGMLMRRRVTGRDNESHVEYKVVCRTCHQESGVHRTKLLATASWEALQKPDDDALLKYRTRRPKK